jgi:hypothetical protein
MRYEFLGRIWFQGSTGAWRFVSLPEELSTSIKTFTGKPKMAFGSLRVEAKIGSTRWQTSIFPDAKRNCYVLPIKSDVRRKESIADGNEVMAAIELYLGL